MSDIQPQHHTHRDDEPLPSKPPYNYEPSAIETAKLPQVELGSKTEGGSSNKNRERSCSRCDRESKSEMKSGSTHHCHSALHEKQPIASQPIPTAEGHHFFNEENPRPRPVSPEGVYL